MKHPLAVDREHILKHTAGVWPALVGARILVTGGTGFIGSWLLESFVSACDCAGLKASAVVLTRSPEAFLRKAPHLAWHRAVELIEGDIRSFAFPEGGFTHVIHGAAEASATLNRERPLLMLDTIVDGTRRALDFAVASHAHRFLFLSSGAVYGAQPPDLERVPEVFSGGPDPMDPEAGYAEGKRVAELMCTLYARQFGLECLIARGFAFTGPHLPLDRHFAIGNFIRDCQAGSPIRVNGDGTPFRSYLYAADLAIWLWTILAHGESCRPYNVGSERAVSIAELAQTVAAIVEPQSTIRVAGVPCPDAPASRYVPDTTRARTELGLAEWIPLDEAIRLTAAACACPAGGVQ
jgi:nucleoside-diphosphate-sugar epimerase